MIRALKFLPLIAAACIAILTIATHTNLGNGRALGETIGAWLTVMIFALVSAGIAWLINRRSENGPLITGAVIAVAMTVLSFNGS